MYEMSVIGLTSLFFFFDLDKLAITGVAAMERSTDILCKRLEKTAHDPISNLRLGSVETPGNKSVRLAHEIIKIYHNHPRCAETVFINTTERILEIMKHCNFKKVASKEELYLLFMKIYRWSKKILPRGKSRRYCVIRRRTAGFEIQYREHNILINWEV